MRSEKCHMKSHTDSDIEVQSYMEELACDRRYSTKQAGNDIRNGLLIDVLNVLIEGLYQGKMNQLDVLGNMYPMICSKLVSLLRVLVPYMLKYSLKRVPGNM